MNTTQVIIAAFFQVAVLTSAIACPPAQRGTEQEVSPKTAMDNQIESTYKKADVVFLARVAQVTMRNSEYGEVEISHLKIETTYKGHPGAGPKFLEKTLLLTCDMRPFAGLGEQVLVFAIGESELIRFSPRQDVEPAFGIRPYERALKYVKAHASQPKP